MNISPISSVSSLLSASSASSSSSGISQIRKQIAALEKKIQEESASQDNDTIKAQKLQMYQSQLQALEAQLQTLQSSSGT